MSEEIKKEIDNYIIQGNSLLKETNNIYNTLRRGKVAPKMLLGVYEAISGSKVKKKKLWSDLGTIWVFNQQYQNLVSVTLRFNQWFNQIIGFVKTISIDKRTLTVRGNSDELLKKFNRPRALKSLDKKIEYSIAALEAIKNMKLVYNKDIPKILKERQSKKITKNKSKYYIIAESVLPKLKKYPAVKEAIVGAIDRLENKGPDYAKQCLGSCRNALESLIKVLSGSQEWSIGLPIIVKSRSDRDVVKKAYSYLCKYGPHNTEIPSQFEAETGFSLTVTAIAILLQ